MDQLKEGIVFKSTGSWYDVFHETKIYKCRTRGKLRLKGYKTTNPIAVGDHVRFLEENDSEGIIQEIVPRDNYIIRRSAQRASHAHIIASNIDQAILIVTLVYPRTSQGFIDRFLVNTESFRIPAVLIFNKSDLLDEELLAHQDEMIEVYESLGYSCFPTSMLEGVGIEEVKEILESKVSLVSGHSGVGKSTFINLLHPNIDQKISGISDFSLKGKHTTTFAEMFQVSEETFIIDTPGIKELGMIDIEDWEVSHYFPEMRKFLGQCKFNDCLHIDEPGCAIRAAIERGEISPSRYISYLSILENDDNRR